jgi:hypothetical protein
VIIIVAIIVEHFYVNSSAMRFIYPFFGRKPGDVIAS